MATKVIIKLILEHNACSHDARLSGRLRFSHRQITTGYTFNRFLPASPSEFLKVTLAGFSAHRCPVMYSSQLAELVVQRAFILV